jgi:hypothetical protein
VDKRGVSGVYALVARVADQVTLLKHQGQSTVAALARGLDALKHLDESRTNTRLQTKRDVMKDHDISISCAVLSVLASIWMILGFGGTGADFRYGIFWLAVAAACMVPTLWDLPDQAISATSQIMGGRREVGVRAESYKTAVTKGGKIRSGTARGRFARFFDRAPPALRKKFQKKSNRHGVFSSRSARSLPCSL